MDDLISRAAALDALGERPMLWINNDEYTLGARNQYDSDRLAIETVPSAQPTAEWLERKVIDDVNIDEWQSAKCSNCGLYHTTPYMYYFSNYKFCPNCGARMHHERTAHSR